MTHHTVERGATDEMKAAGVQALRAILEDLRDGATDLDLELQVTLIWNAMDKAHAVLAEQEKLND